MNLIMMLNYVKTLMKCLPGALSQYIENRRERACYVKIIKSTVHVPLSVSEIFECVTVFPSGLKASEFETKMCLFLFKYYTIL